MAKVRRRTRRFILSGAALFVAAGCTASADAQPLIQGGSVHYSPFLARVAYGVGGVEEALCSGTVITPHWILTAGHCVGNPEEAGGKTFPPSYFKVYTGNVNWTKATLSTVSEALRNPNYYSNHLVPPNDDVGMLHLSSAVTVEPIQLATPTTFANEVKVGASVSATGFGLTSPGAPVPPEDMYLVTGLTVEYFPEHEAGENNDVEIGSVASKGTCSGDSGGPFIDSAGEEVAITSAGPANACNQTAAQRIDLVDPWITESVEKSEPPTVSSISPTAGLPGTEVAIHGLWMKKATGVSFGSTPAAKFTVISASEIKATVPAGRGVVDVRVSNANGPSPVVAGDKFNQLAPETRISYTGPEHAVKGQASTLSAHLVEAATAAPLAGATVRFEAAGTNCEATTESAGNAQCSITPAAAGAGKLTAQFAGSGSYLASSTTAHFAVWAKSSGPATVQLNSGEFGPPAIVGSEYVMYGYEGWYLETPAAQELGCFLDLVKGKLTSNTSGKIGATLDEASGEVCSGNWPEGTSATADFYNATAGEPLFTLSLSAKEKSSQLPVTLSPAKDKKTYMKISFASATCQYGVGTMKGHYRGTYDMFMAFEKQKLKLASTLSTSGCPKDAYLTFLSTEWNGASPFEMVRY